MESFEKKTLTSDDNCGLVSNIKGKITEAKVIKDYREAGYTIIKLRVNKYNPYTKRVSFFFNDHHFDSFFKGYDGDKEELRSLIKENLLGCPDFLVLKDGKVTFLEIKTGKAELSENQILVRKKLLLEGFDYKVIRVNVEFSLEYIDDDRITPKSDEWKEKKAEEKNEV